MRERGKNNKGENENKKKKEKEGLTRPSPGRRRFLILFGKEKGRIVEKEMKLDTWQGDFQGRRAAQSLKNASFLPKDAYFRRRPADGVDPLGPFDSIFTKEGDSRPFGHVFSGCCSCVNCALGV